jgi:hypothetical protein
MVKETLCTALVFACSQPSQRFVVDTDVSNVGIQGMLSQVQDGEEQVIAYYSKMLNKAERNYCVAQWKLLAIIRMLEHFHKYLYRQEFHMLTDHSTSTWLMSFKNLEGLTAHWIQCLHNNADALSQ